MKFKSTQKVNLTSINLKSAQRVTFNLMQSIAQIYSNLNIQQIIKLKITFLNNLNVV